MAVITEHCTRVPKVAEVVMQNITSTWLYCYTE